MAPHPHVWTAERNEIIRREWPAGTHSAEVVRMVNATPGPAVSAQRCGAQASYLCAKRPDGFRPGKKRRSFGPWTQEQIDVLLEMWPAGVPTNEILDRLAELGRTTTDAVGVAHKAAQLRIYRPKKEKPKPRISPPPVPLLAASFDAVAFWARQNGVPFREWDDIGPVNAKRLDVGLAPFKPKDAGTWA